MIDVDRLTGAALVVVGLVWFAHHAWSLHRARRARVHAARMEARRRHPAGKGLRSPEVADAMRAEQARPGGSVR